MDRKILASYIDHTNLKPDASKADIEKLCNEAKEYGFISVCINPYYVSFAKKQLKDTNVKVCAVIGFPLGASITDVKVFEASQAIKDGADEIDMVINISALKEGDLEYTEKDIKAVAEACKGKALLKVIIENCLLNDSEKVKACQIAKSANADFVKTSTGFSKSGAKLEDIILMRKTVGKDMGIKAAGGIRDLTRCLSMIEAGANRIGASASLEIIDGIEV